MIDVSANAGTLFAPGVSIIGPSGNKVDVDGSGNLKTVGSGGGPATIADGADVAEGATTAAAVAGDVAGSVSAKLRQLNKIFTALSDLTRNVLAVGIYGKTSVAGDTALLSTAAGRILASLGPQEAEAILVTNGNTVYPMGSADFPQPLGVSPQLYVPNYQTSANNINRNQRTIDATVGQTFYPIKTALATSNGSTALWTPQAGKKFRIMRFPVIVPSNANVAAGADITIDLLDGTITMGLTFTAFIPTLAVTTGGQPIFYSGWIDLGNGILSGAADRVLNINLSVAITGGVRVLACGTEE